MTIHASSGQAQAARPNETKSSIVAAADQSPTLRDKSLSQGKDSASYQSPADGTGSSYLHFQRFSRDGKQILRQMQTSPSNLVPPHRDGPLTTTQKL